MECESNSYASGFLKYLKDFVANIRPDDPLPVRAPSYKVTETEIDGQILDIVHHYLNSRECPPYVREYVGHRVWTAIRNPGVNGDGGEDDVDGPNATTTNHTFDAMKLIQEVTGKANSVIREMAQNLTVDDVDKLPRYHPISHFAIKNTRRKMEDRHVIIHDLNTLYGMKYDPPHAYYGVFDGHAGTDAAVYSAAHLHQYMMQNPQYETNPEAALKHAFHITDTNFIKKAAKERLKGGTTAVVALVREKRLVVAWLGDSQALLVRRRNPVRMVEPHKPELPVERERVEEMGGCVINIQGTWRVLGQLAVSRAIGDADYKPYVSSECDIKSLEIEGDEDFLILACDGLWDTLSAEDAVNVVYAYLTHNNGDTDGVGRCLVEAARSTGSEDNITAVVVFLRPVATLMEEEAQRIAQGQVPDEVPAVVMEKDSTPSSINAIFSPPIFSPPINQFELSETSSPKLFNPDEYGNFDMNNHNDAQNAAAPAMETSTYKDQDEPMEGSEAPVMPPHDSDSDEGIAVGAEGTPTPATQAFNPHEAPTPTAEEVDAALAELDSIPDGVCESGEVEEEEEDEEEWSYYRMEPQTQPQGEDVLGGATTTNTTTTTAPAPSSEDFEIIAEKSDMVQDIVPVPQEKTQDTTVDQSPELIDDLDKDFNHLSESQPKNELVESIEEKKDIQPMEADEAPLVEKTSDILESNMDVIPSLDDHPERLINFSGPGIEKADGLMMESGFEPGSSPHGSGSPRVPGSPRSVEGFVTSVELNTPDESFATNFAVNQNQDPFTGVVDQTSGPFSVYVSSSPEPASLDPPMQASVDLMNMSAGMTNGQVDDEHPSTNQTEPRESPVEIVHAQSTVEVVAPPSPVDVLLTGPETQFVPHPDQQVSDEITSKMPPTDISFVPQPVIEPSAEVPVPVYVDDTPVSEPDFIPEGNQSVSEAAFGDLINVSQTVEEVSETKMKMDEMNMVNASQTVEDMFETKMKIEDMNTVNAAQVDDLSFETKTKTDEVNFSVETSSGIANQVESFIETSQKDICETQSQMESMSKSISHMESSEITSHMEMQTETKSHMEMETEMKSHMEMETEMKSHMEMETEMKSHMEMETETKSHMETETEIKSHMETETETKHSEMSQITSSPVPAEVGAVSPFEVNAASPVLSPVQSSPILAESETVPISETPVSEITKPVETEVVSAPITNIPEEATKSVKSPEPKAPAKATKTPAKSAVNKAPAKTTPGKATPSRSTPSRPTPGKATPSKTTPTTTTSRTPLTKTPSTRTPGTKTPVPKSTEKKTPTTKPATPSSGARPTASRSTPTRPAAAKPAEAKPATTRTTAARPAPTRTLPAKSTTAKPGEKPTTKATGTTAPKPGAAARTTTTRPTPASRTSAPTRKPLDSTKSADKTDGSKSASSSRPGTARSTTTAARKPLSSSTARGATKPAAEKETKNTTNQILSTRPTKTALTSRTATKTSAAHSTSKVTESTNTAKSRVTSTARSTASKTTGAATKKTLVSKSKTTTGAKEDSLKTKTEATVIDNPEPIVNGENKIADEETSVEVIEKCAVEDIMQASTEKVITSSEQVVVTTEMTEVLVNGDH